MSHYRLAPAGGRDARPTGTRDTGTRPTGTRSIGKGHPNRQNPRVEPLEAEDRLEGDARARGAQGSSVHIDPFLQDPSARKPELVDAAPVQAPAIGEAGRLPLDHHGIAAGAPVEQLPKRTDAPKKSRWRFGKKHPPQT